MSRAQLANNNADLPNFPGKVTSNRKAMMTCGRALMIVITYTLRVSRKTSLYRLPNSMALDHFSFHTKHAGFQHQDEHH